MDPLAISEIFLRVNIRSIPGINTFGLNGKFLRFRRDDPFLKRLVTCDEKWIFYDNVIRKRQWCRPGEAQKPTPKKNLHSKKLMFCVWWDMEGIITSS
jgi:histone-lysine N-methyltransferase SETMAR